VRLGKDLADVQRRIEEEGEEQGDPEGLLAGLQEDHSTLTAAIDAAEAAIRDIDAKLSKPGKSLTLQRTNREQELEKLLQDSQEVDDDLEDVQRRIEEEGEEEGDPEGLLAGLQEDRSTLTAAIDAAEAALRDIVAKLRKGCKKGGKTKKKTKDEYYQEWLELTQEAEDGGAEATAALGKFEQGAAWIRILSECKACGESFPGVSDFFSKTQLDSKASGRRCKPCVKAKRPVKDTTQQTMDGFF
jgi:chromosome segregation ATPase